MHRFMQYCISTASPLLPEGDFRPEDKITPWQLLHFCVSMETASGILTQHLTYLAASDSAWLWIPDWFQKRHPSSSSHPEEDGWCQRMMACLLYPDGTAWANLCSGELLPVLCPIELGRSQQCHRMTEVPVYFFFLFFSCANHFHFCTGVALGICQFLHLWRQYLVFSLIL